VQSYQSVGVENVDHLGIDRQEEMTSLTELHFLAVLYLNVLVMPQLIVQDMVHTDLVDKASREVIATWMESHRYQRLGSFSDSHILKHVVFSS
jgi:hypothetical protein